MAIKINADEMRAKANQIRQFKSNHTDAINSIRSTIQTLCKTEDFDGNAASAYLNRFEGMADTFTKFEALLEELAVSLDSTAKVFEDMDNGLAAHANGSAT